MVTKRAGLSPGSRSPTHAWSHCGWARQESPQLGFKFHSTLASRVTLPLCCFSVDATAPCKVSATYAGLGDAQAHCLAPGMARASMFAEAPVCCAGLWTLRAKARLSVFCRRVWSPAEDTLLL
jgi:hypothetical protein